MKANGHLAICDFGTSKTLRRTPTDGAPPAPASDDAARTRGLEPLTKSIIGTPAYMAPEMLLEQPYSYSVDWWALGVTYAAAAAKSLAQAPFGLTFCGVETAGVALVPCVGGKPNAGTSRCSARGCRSTAARDPARKSKRRDAFERCIFGRRVGAGVVPNTFTFEVGPAVGVPAQAGTTRKKRCSGASSSRGRATT